MMMVRRKRLVRLHLDGDKPSLEGILAGQPAGHYRLLKPVMLRAAGQSDELDGELLVPRERVVFVQELR